MGESSRTHKNQWKSWEILKEVATYEENDRVLGFITVKILNKKSPRNSLDGR